MKDRIGEDTEMCVQFMKERFAIAISVYDISFPEKTIQGIPEANSHLGFFRNPPTLTMQEQAIIPKKSDIKRTKMQMSSAGTKYRPIKNYY